ncbi:50S ribosomal protein L35 [candidate division WOR-3 bacterium]|nr:50S ribosomal protein L35 [candidate division WOR-3 bacterium]
MKKIKLHSKGTIKKRFKKTGSGKVKRFRAYHRHKLFAKSSKRKRVLKKSTVLDKADEKRVKAFLQ